MTKTIFVVLAVFVAGAIFGQSRRGLSPSVRTFYVTFPYEIPRDAAIKVVGKADRLDALASIGVTVWTQEEVTNCIKTEEAQSIRAVLKDNPAACKNWTVKTRDQLQQDTIDKYYRAVKREPQVTTYESRFAKGECVPFIYDGSGFVPINDGAMECTTKKAK
jgi:hypothetical protein